MHCKILFILSFLANFISRCQGHGFLTTPKSRNADDYCAHCVNAGGPDSVYANGYTHGLCGNEPNDNPQNWNEASQSPIAIGTSGDSVLLEVVITAHHLGFFEFELCDSPDISEECFSSHRLLRSDCDPEVEGEEACRRWWKPLKQEEYGHYSLTPQGYPDGAPYLSGCSRVTYSTYFDLPEDVSCTHCVLRWHWLTTNSCTSSDSVGEEFWNCADVSIDAPDGQTTADTRPDDYDALNAILTSTMPVDLSDTMTSEDNWRCPEPAYGTAGEYFCGSDGDVTGTDGCYASLDGETCTISFYESDIEPIVEGTPQISYCTWSGMCLADGQGGSEWCDESEVKCDGCGGMWCLGYNDMVTTTIPDEQNDSSDLTTTNAPQDPNGPGYCAWYECTGSVNSEWCDDSPGNCEGPCNGVWCPTDPVLSDTDMPVTVTVETSTATTATTTLAQTSSTGTSEKVTAQIVDSSTTNLRSVSTIASSVPDLNGENNNEDGSSFFSVQSHACDMQLALLLITVASVAVIV